MRLHVVIGLLATAFVIACGENDAPRHVRQPQLSVSIIPFLTPAEATNMAKELARTNGIDLRSYDEPVVTSEVKSGELTWRASFKMRSPEHPGGHFVVLVKDGTKQATYLAGE